LGIAGFVVAGFAGDAWFDKAQFTQEASFIKAHFSATAHFDAAQFTYTSSPRQSRIRTITRTA
jgi:hypothetical protein